MNNNFLYPWPPDEKYSNPNLMPVTKFKDKYRGMIVRIPGANKLPISEDEHLFNKVADRYLDNPKYRVVSVHEHETGDFVDFSIPTDTGNQPYKIGYYILKNI
jgi:hypothetical protein